MIMSVEKFHLTLQAYLL